LPMISPKPPRTKAKSMSAVSTYPESYKRSDEGRAQQPNSVKPGDRSSCFPQAIRSGLKPQRGSPTALAYKCW
jgi:hypothetical protein